MLNDESSKKSQQIDQIYIDQSKEPIPIENVITPTPRRTSRVSHPPERYIFLHDMQELHVKRLYIIKMILLHMKRLYIIKILQNGLKK